MSRKPGCPRIHAGEDVTVGGYIGKSTRGEIEYATAHGKPVEYLGLPAVGYPGVRDPESPCEHFRPGSPTERGDCQGDGHYLCRECKEKDAGEADA